MGTIDYSSMTVVDLRKIAKEYGIVLGAGKTKSEIVAMLEHALGTEEDESTPLMPNKKVSHDSAGDRSDSSSVSESEDNSSPSQPQFRAAWHNPGSVRYAGKNTFGQRNPSPSANSRPSFVRQQTYTQRFGPAASVPAEPQPEPRSTIYREESAAEQSPSLNTSVSSWNAPARPTAPERHISRPSGPAQDSEPAASLSAAELLAPVELVEGEGILELHSDGYGFLRTDTLLPSPKDIYISAAQVKRFTLRSGDLVHGKVRPIREGDRFAAMLGVTQVNGSPVGEQPARTPFDQLTPVYASRLIRLDQAPSAQHLRLIDLLAPIGFGSRAMIISPADYNKTSLLCSLGNAIAEAHPDAIVITILLNANPEDITLFKEKAKTRVLSTTFDQPPENHIRLIDLTVEYAQRHVEAGKDVVVLADSLTCLAKVFTTAAAQQGRAVPGTVNPSSLYRAKRLFGAARALREGGSLTILGVLNSETGTRVDDAILEEFRDAATTIIQLDNAISRAGINPPINPMMSVTRRADALLSEERRNGIQQLRSVLSPSQPAAFLQQLLSMIDSTSDDDDLLRRVPSWLAMMRDARSTTT